MIKGLGRGLTPQGDDFIAGLLFALQVRGRVSGKCVEREIRAIGEAAGSGNPFSRAMLECAARGRAFERLKSLIVALFEGDGTMIKACITELTAIGATSGADIAAGLAFGLEQIH